MTLCDDSLTSVPTDIARFQYDRDELKCGVVHCSTGMFHRAHQCYFYDQYMNQTNDLRWGVTAIGLRPNDADICRQLNDQGGLFSVTDWTSDNTSSTYVVGCLKQAIFAAEDPQKALDVLASSDTHMFTVTVTEHGHYLTANGHLDAQHADIVHDRNHSDRPKTVAGLIVEGLYRRFSAGLDPFTVVCCDNIPNNGTRLCEAVMEVAQLQHRSEEFTEWLHQVSFPNTMVDCITPVLRPDTVEHAKSQLSVEDTCAVACEHFRQWVVESNITTPFPSLINVSRPQLEFSLVDNIHSYELMKIRILNGSHLTLAMLGELSGYKYIHEAVQDPLLHRFARAQMSEVLATLPAIRGADHSEYCDLVLSRFSNAHLRDSVARVAADSSLKMVNSIHAPLIDLLRRSSPKSSSTVLTACIAIWMKYLVRRRVDGSEFRFQDPLQQKFQQRWEPFIYDIVLSAAVSPASAASTFFSSFRSCFDQRIYDAPGFRAEVSKAWAAIQNTDVRQYVSHLLTASGH